MGAMERRPIILDTSVLIRAIGVGISEADRTSAYRELLDKQPDGVFITTQVAREVDRKIGESDRFGAEDVPRARSYWESELGPGLRVVDVCPQDIRSERVKIVADADPDDWPTAALVDALSPALVLTDNVKDLKAAMGPLASSADTDIVAIAAKDVAAFVNGMEKASVGSVYGGAMVTDGVKWLHGKVGTDGLLLIAACGLIVVLIHGERIGRAARGVAGVIGPALGEASLKHTRQLDQISGTMTQPTIEAKLHDRLARAVAVAPRWGRRAEALASMFSDWHDIDVEAADVLREADADRWLSVEGDSVYLGMTFQRWRELNTVEHDA